MKTPRVSDFDPYAKAPKLKSSMDGFPSIEKQNQPNFEAKKQPVPVGVPPPVPPSLKVRRPIKERQPFDIYEDQYKSLKKIAETERGFVNGRGMSQMVREAIDNYLRDHSASKK